MAKRRIWFSMPSWWVVVVAGGLFLTFSVSIIREIINSNQVRTQVRRLEAQVASESQRQRQLQDLIDYLGSPTFQEQEARLKLGLKKNGEQVIVVPATNASNSPLGEQTTTEPAAQNTGPVSNPQQWWNYFFKQRSATSTSNA